MMIKGFLDIDIDCYQILKDYTERKINVPFKGKLFVVRDINDQGTFYIKLDCLATGRKILLVLEYLKDGEKDVVKNLYNVNFYEIFCIFILSNNIMFKINLPNELPVKEKCELIGDIGEKLYLDHMYNFIKFNDFSDKDSTMEMFTYFILYRNNVLKNKSEEYNYQKLLVFLQEMMDYWDCSNLLKNKDEDYTKTHMFEIIYSCILGIINNKNDRPLSPFNSYAKYIRK